MYYFGEDRFYWLDGEFYGFNYWFLDVSENNPYTLHEKLIYIHIMLFIINWICTSATG